MAKRRKKKSLLGIGKIVVLLLFLGFLVNLFDSTEKPKHSIRKEPIEKKEFQQRKELVKREETTYDFSSRKVTETSGASSWIFEGKHKPPLNLSEKTGFIKTVNASLQAAGLPLVSRFVPERSSLTGSRIDRGDYLWEDYQLGSLTVQRSLCRDVNYKNYDCIWKLTLHITN